MRARGLVGIERRPPEAKIAGSNPAGPANQTPKRVRGDSGFEGT